MPIYEYKCQSCHKEFELLSGVTSAAEKLECPHCRSSEIDKLFSTFGFRSSGSGDGDYSSGDNGSSGCSSCTTSNCGPCKG